MDTTVASTLRTEYETVGLMESDMVDQPFSQFEQWFAAAIEAGIEEPNAFVLATATASGRPSARAVLMKSFGTDGLGFHTGMASRKSREIAANPHAAATFVWLSLHRQVRFEGVMLPVDPAAADTYFATRPRGARIAAHASRQSEVVASREELEQRFTRFDASFGDDVPRPDDWSGWRLVPEMVEFWQGRPNRFHDRLRYRLDEGSWVLERLAP